MANADARTQQLFDRAMQVMPGRQSNFRALPGNEPFFLDAANGLRYTDSAGNRYIDYTLSMGAAIWGYSDPEYRQAIIDQMDSVLAMSSGVGQTEREVELAEAIVERVPCAEWVRFGISGSEAVQLAFRLSRAYTGRPYFLRFDGHYHGWLDNVAGGTPAPPDSDTPFGIHREDDPGRTEGRSPHALNESIICPWNDADALEEILKVHGDQIAAVAMESIMCNFGCCPPRPGYLERVRELCDEYGCVLFFDEVITGFRVAPGGGQEAVGVTPDLCTFGKALGGGMPLSAVAGKKDILSLLRDNRVMGGGTFNAFPLAMAAGVASMKLFDADGRSAYRKMAARQEQLNASLKASAEKHGHALLLQGPLGVTYVNFLNLDTAWTPADLSAADHAKAARFKAKLMENGVLMAGGNRWFISPNHTEQDLEETRAIIDKVFGDLV